MAKITIGHKNLVDGSGVTITSSTEVAGFAAENVQAAQASQRFGTATLNPSWIQADLQTGKPYQLVALVGTNAAAHRNMLPFAQSPDNATYWTATDWSVAADSLYPYLPALPGIPLWALTYSGASSTPSLVSAAVSSVDTADAALKVTAHLSGPATTDDTYVLTVADGANTASVDVVVSGGDITLGNPSNSGMGLPANLTATEIDTALGIWRLSFTTQGHITSSAISYTFACGGATTASTVKRWGAPQVEVFKDVASAVAAPAAAITHNAANHAATWRFLADPTDPTSSPDVDLPAGSVAMGGDLTGRSVVDSYLLMSQEYSLRHVRVEISDPANADSRLEIGRLVICPVWQPQESTFVNHTFRWSDSGKFRIWTINLGNKVTEKEAYGELHDLARNLQVTSSSKLRETPGGQLIAPDGTKPVVIILDPDEVDNAATQMIYGFVTALNAEFRGGFYSATDSAVVNGFGVQLEVWESIA